MHMVGLIRGYNKLNNTNHKKVTRTPQYLSGLTLSPSSDNYKVISSVDEPSVLADLDAMVDSVVHIGSPVSNSRLVVVNGEDSSEQYASGYSECERKRASEHLAQRSLLCGCTCSAAVLRYSVADTTYLQSYLYSGASFHKPVKVQLAADSCTARNREDWYGTLVPRAPSSRPKQAHLYILFLNRKFNFMSSSLGTLGRVLYGQNKVISRLVPASGVR